jgi:hypothetical protein
MSSPAPAPAAAAPAAAAPSSSCAYCGNASAPSRCGGCRLVSYCDKLCQIAHFRQGHKLTCKTKEQLTYEYPASTLDDLRRAFPQHTIIDGSAVTLQSLPDWVDKLEANPMHLLVVLRRRSASCVTPSDKLFQLMGHGASDELSGVGSSLAVAAAILVFHKDDYYHLCVEPLPKLVRFLRRHVDEHAEGVASDCPVCFENLPLEYTHRMECTTCGMRVCGPCVVSIKERAKGHEYVCPGCRDKPAIKLYEV